MSAGRDDDLRAEPTTEDPKEAWQRSKVALFKFWIERSRTLYARTRNPIHAFQAYRAARAAKIDVPEWVLELFDQWAKVLCEERPKGIQKIAAALGLGTKGGGPSITSQAEKESRSMWIAEHVLAQLDRKPQPTMQELFCEVAEKFDLSSERVASIWYEQTRGAKY